MVQIAAAVVPRWYRNNRDHFLFFSLSWWSAAFNRRKMRLLIGTGSKETQKQNKKQGRRNIVNMLRIQLSGRFEIPAKLVIMLNGDILMGEIKGEERKRWC